MRESLREEKMQKDKDEMPDARIASQPLADHGDLPRHATSPSERDYGDDYDEDDTCHDCEGAGGYHDCGEDSCCCGDTGEDDDDWEVCDSCDGSGTR